MILDEILRHKRGEVAAAAREVPLARVEEAASAAPPSRPFGAALRQATGAEAVRVIAEIKKRSPAMGTLAPAMNVPTMARVYADAGAAAISVLTDERFFAGSLGDLRAVREVTSLPVLRKEFVISPYQLYEARAAGADAALLIVAALASPLADMSAAGDPCGQGNGASPDLAAAAERLVALLGVARSAGLECLVEVHDEAEMGVALGSGATIVGVNNRDLRTFVTTLEVTERLARHVPEGVVLVSESGINSRDDVRRVRRAGADAVLVGTAIVSAADPGAKLRELAG
jgi:indole-3-glycerol phosphate synthase